MVYEGHMFHCQVDHENIIFCLITTGVAIAWRLLVLEESF